MRILTMGTAAVCLAASAAWGQIGSGSASGGIGGAGAGGGIGGNIGGSLGTTGRGGSRSPNTGSIGDDSPLNQRPVFISGKIALSDGAALPEPAKIERMCGSSVRLEAHTDPKGRFSFEVGRSTELPDASGGVDPTGGGFGVPSRSRDSSLFGCDLRFSLPGFRSETVSLSNSRYLDNSDLGTIILHRIANVEGLTISATSALAPKDAKKAFEKGMEAEGKKNFAEAQKDFEKASELYPRYAAAWYELGRLDEQGNRNDAARKAYEQSLAADSKYVPPYERLAWICLRESKWQELGDDTDAILRLNPIDYPDAYYLSSVANLELGKLDAAEKSAREAVTRDTAHKNPRTTYVLGLILARKQQFDAAAPLLRAFLEQNPEVSDATVVRQQLSAIEEAAREKATAAQAKP